MTSKRLLTLLYPLVLLLSLGTVRAEEQVTLQVYPPRQAVVGEAFRLQLIVSDKASDPVWSFPSGLEVVYGPAVSRSSSTRIVNGKTSRSSSTTFTYTLVADHAGKYDLPAATVMVDGSTYKSSPTSFEVYESEAVTPEDAGTEDESPRDLTESEVAELGNDALQVVAQVSKTTVYEQEAILVSYKLYSRYQGIQIESANFPEYDGFVKQEIPQQGSLQLDIEQYQGRNYYTVTLLKQLLFPQKSGTLSVPAGSFGLVVTLPKRSDDPDDFFSNFFGSYQRVRKEVKTKPFTIRVKPLPTPQPEDFTGAVGRFSLSAEMPEGELRTGESLQMKVTLSGTGNLKLATLPEVEWPEGFEAYDPKDEEQLSVTTSGVTGSKSREYIAIPRYEGSYTLPGVSCSYFDPSDGTYHREELPARTVQVAKGSGSAAPTSEGALFGNREEMKVLGNDIRYLKPADRSTHMTHLSLTGYGLLYLLLLLVAVVLFFVLRTQRAGGVETAQSRSRRAGKRARKYLRLANQERSRGDDTAYYEALLRGLNDYLCAKLRIAPSDLSKERIEEVMSSCGLPEERIRETLSLQSELEIARFTPQHEADDRDRLFDAASRLIDALESSKIKIADH